MTYDDVRESLSAKLDKLGTDELGVLNELAARLVMGRSQYGELKLAADRRNWRNEAAAESLDLAIYLTCEMLSGNTGGTK